MSKSKLEAVSKRRETKEGRNKKKKVSYVVFVYGTPCDPHRRGWIGEQPLLVVYCEEKKGNKCTQKQKKKQIMHLFLHSCGTIYHPLQYL